jgi:hypothetical protein
LYANYGSRVVSALTGSVANAIRAIAKELLAPNGDVGIAVPTSKKPADVPGAPARPGQAAGAVAGIAPANDPQGGWEL